MAFYAIEARQLNFCGEPNYNHMSFPGYNYGKDFLSITKGDIIITIYFDSREGVSLFLTKSGNTFDKRKGFVNFLNAIYPLFSEEQKMYSEKLRELLTGFESRTAEFYFQSLKIQIQFIQEHFPDLIEKGSSRH